MMDETTGKFTIFLIILSVTVKINCGEVKYVELGQSIQLDCCCSKTKINCSWRRNETLVQISKRYTYTNNHDGNGVSCTLTIKNVSEIDATIWHCQNTVEDTSQTVSLNNTYRVFITNQLSFGLTTSTKNGPETTTTGSTQTRSTDKSVSIEFSTGMIILIASCNVVLVAVIIGLVIFLCKYISKQRSLNENINKAAEEKEVKKVTNPNDQNPEGYYNVYNVADTYRKNQMDSEEYMIPRVPAVPRSVDLDFICDRKFYKGKPSNHLNQPEMVSDHVYEKIYLD